MSKITRKVLFFAASTIFTGSVTSVGTLIANKLQTQDNKTIQEEINEQFVENDRQIIEMLDKINKRLENLEKK